MKGITILKRKHFDSPVNLMGGDYIQAVYTEWVDGERVERVLADYAVTRVMVVDEAVIFGAEAGVLGVGAAIGGAFIEKTR